MTDVHVREALPGDLPAVAAVHLDAAVTGYAGIFPEAAPVPTIEELGAAWARELTQRAATTLVAEEAGAVVGTVTVRPDPDFPGEGQLRRLHVAPRRWGTGVGGRLHDEAMQLLEARGFRLAGLWVLEDNLRGRRFYESRGWVLVPGVTPDGPGPAAEVRYRRSCTAARDP
ncbi:MAG TPA: GNAT family N-acetyltransferase [Acidimicrobiales bacterium]|nr:GNAT family N-acetyltransferase [Acidimicrobiales bacterium]